MFANVRTDIGVRSDVLLQHARLLTADATLSTDILSPAATPHVNILFIALIPETQGDGEDKWEEKQTETRLLQKTKQ